MELRVIKGREFTAQDNEKSPLVVIISETLARTTWPGEEAIGKHVKVPEIKDWLTVVGVVGDTKHRSSSEPSQPQLYLAHYQLPMIFTSLVARTKVPPLTLTNDVRRAVWTVDKDQPMWSIAPLDTLVGNSHGSTRFLAMLLAIFSGVALLLASVGIYGVMSYAVTERTHEIGIRMALGASATRVMGEIVRRGLALTGVALLVGVPAAIGLGRLAGVFCSAACNRRRRDARRRGRAPGCCVGRRLLRASAPRITRGPGGRTGRGIRIWLISLVHAPDDAL
jgi:putative ABC transport system permease protein